MLCPKCGMDLLDDDVFCAYCGAKLAGAAGGSPSAPAGSPVGIVPPKPTPTVTAPKPMPKPAPKPAPAGTAGAAGTEIPPEPYTAPAGETAGGAGAKVNRSSTAVIAGAVAGVLVVGGALLFWKPGFLVNKDSTDSSSGSSSSQSDRPAETQQGETSRGEAVPSGETVTGQGETTITAPQETSEPETTTTTTAETTTTAAATTTTTAAATTTTTAATTAATTAPATTTTKQTTAAGVDLEEKNRIYAEAMALSTGDRPKFEEFEWCFGQGGLVYEPAADADIIRDPLGYSGAWKAMVIYNPSNMAGTFIRELDNLDIGVYDDTCMIVVDWYFMSIDGSEEYNEEDLEDMNFFGTLKVGGLKASGSSDAGTSELSLNYLWREDGKQYALGEMVTPDGLPAYVALVRP